MIDKTQPRYEFTEGDAMDGRPGILVVPDERGYRLAFSGYDWAYEEANVVRLRQEYATAIADWMAKAAVVDFAERVAAWVTPDETGTSPAYREWFRDEQCGRPVPLAYMPWLAAQILAAARGERSLP